MIRSANKLKELVLGIEIRCIGIIRADIQKRYPKFITSRKIKAELNRSGILNPADFKYLYDRLMDIYLDLRLKFAKTVKKDRIDVLNDSVESSFDSLLSVRNALAGRLESRAKIAELRNLAGVFYVCSVFKDAAPDHKEYQGKLYYTDDWKEKVPETQHDKIARFISRKKLSSVSDVCFSAPYLITRPNCRHRLSGVSIKDALSGNWEAEVMDKEVRSVSERRRIRMREAKKYRTVLGLKDKK